VSGFGGGTIYFPTSTAEGTFGAVAVAPGFTATQSCVAWLGPRIASQGFVVFVIDTVTTFDQPDARGTELLAALDYVELAGATHFAPNSPNTTIARYAISWLKEFVDNDDRYDQFVCGAGAGTEATIDDYRTTCPLTN
jgi:hypothetical protein